MVACQNCVISNAKLNKKVLYTTGFIRITHEKRHSEIRQISVRHITLVCNREISQEILMKCIYVSSQWKFIEMIFIFVTKLVETNEKIT